MLKKIAGSIICILLLYGLYTYQLKREENIQSKPVTLTETTPTPSPTKTEEPTPTPTTNIEWQFPISEAKIRVTKKPFGIYITKENSPVSPERFYGYHTGVDFEAAAEEQNTEVYITAVCSGKILQKKWVSGYGGVVIQGCQLEGQNVTVLYGHLNIDSVKNNPPAGGSYELKAGNIIGVLGKGYTKETDFERKHLHLSIHKGENISLLGYVQNKEQLSNWLDPLAILK